MERSDKSFAIVDVRVQWSILKFLLFGCSC